jgi:hypothetical protein
MSVLEHKADLPPKSMGRSGYDPSERCYNSNPNGMPPFSPDSATAREGGHRHRRRHYWITRMRRMTIALKIKNDD